MLGPIIRAGDLRHRPMLQRLEESVDAAGGLVHEWVDVLEVFAKCEYLSGRELEAAQRINAAVQARFTVNYRTLSPKDNRFAWDAKNWNIHAILPDTEKRYSALLVSETK